MKTIKQKSGKIERVNDKEAEMRVKSGGWDYCPKSEYKAITRKPKTEDSDDKPRKGKTSSQA
jgi:hypothetical protein